MRLSCSIPPARRTVTRGVALAISLHASVVAEARAHAHLSSDTQTAASTLDRATAFRSCVERPQIPIVLLTELVAFAWPKVDEPRSVAVAMCDASFGVEAAHLVHAMPARDAASSPFALRARSAAFVDESVDARVIAAAARAERNFRASLSVFGSSSGVQQRIRDIDRFRLFAAAPEMIDGAPLRSDLLVRWPVDHLNVEKLLTGAGTQWALILADAHLVTRSLDGAPHGQVLTEAAHRTRVQCAACLTEWEFEIDALAREWLQSDRTARDLRLSSIQGVAMSATTRLVVELHALAVEAGCRAEADRWLCVHLDALFLELELGRSLSAVATLALNHGGVSHMNIDFAQQHFGDALVAFALQWIQELRRPRIDMGALLRAQEGAVSNSCKNSLLRLRRIELAECTRLLETLPPVLRTHCRGMLAQRSQIPTLQPEFEVPNPLESH